MGRKTLINLSLILEVWMSVFKLFMVTVWCQYHSTVITRVALNWCMSVACGLFVIKPVWTRCLKNAVMCIQTNTWRRGSGQPCYCPPAALCWSRYQYEEIFWWNCSAPCQVGGNEAVYSRSACLILIFPVLFILPSVLVQGHFGRLARE